MRRRPVLVLLVTLTVITLALGVALWQGARREVAQQISEQSTPSLAGAPRSVAPDFTLPALNGRTLRLSDLRGKVVLLNFWATWCPPCKAEMPDLDALHRQYGAEHDFLVLGVNVEESEEIVRKFVDENRINFPIVLDEDGDVAQRLYGVRPLPTSMIIDRQGFIRDAWNGQIRVEAMLARLEKVW